MGKMGIMGRGGARRRTRRRQKSMAAGEAAEVEKKHQAEMAAVEEKHKAELAEAKAKEAPKEAAASGGDDLAEIEKWADAKKKGLITEEEFAAKKKQILGL